MEKNIPINKGNYTMESAEREALFEKKRAAGWEEEYRKYRENWREYPQKQFVAEYPLLVDLELSSLCNLKCPMCYTITDEFKKKVNTQLMEYELFTKIIDEIAGKVPAVRLSLRGEATLHPQFISCISYCKSRGIGEVSFLTNGSKLTRDYFIQVMDAGADWITISVDGLQEQYESIRNPLKFNDIFQKIKEIQKAKKERNAQKPVIKVQGIWPSIRDDADAYYHTFAPYVDLVAFNPLIDYLDKDEDIVYEPDFSCPQLYQRLVIGSDGRVLLCSNDEDGMQILGDVHDHSVYEIWHGEKLNQIRKLHQNGKFTELHVCQKCYLPRATEENERTVINGREIVIKNYINRAQKIGE